MNSVIRLTEGIDYEFIIIDNNSEPDIEKKILKETPVGLITKVKFLLLPVNIGFGRANNEGLKIAEGRNILFLNPDILLKNKSIKILSDFLDSHPDAGACGGNLYSIESTPIFSFKRLLPGILWESDELLNTIPQRLLFGKNRNHNHSHRPISVKFISGADLMVKKSVLDTIGGFDPNYFLYFEDTDLCRRILKTGWHIYNVPAAKFCHLESKSFQENRSPVLETKIRHQEKGRKIYYSKNLSPFSRMVSNIIYDWFLKSRILLSRNPYKKQFYKIRRKYTKS